MTSRQRLVESAELLLWDRGYIGTSPRAIQVAAGTGQGSMYHHFRGKRDLAREAVDLTAQNMRKTVERLLLSPDPALSCITEYLISQRDALRGCPIGRLTYDPDILSDPVMKQSISEMFEWQRALLVEVIDRGKASGEFDCELDAHDLAATIAATLQGAYILARASGEVAPFHRAVNGLLHLLTRYRTFTAH